MIVGYYANRVQHVIKALYRKPVIFKPTTEFQTIVIRVLNDSGVLSLELAQAVCDKLSYLEIG